MILAALLLAQATTPACPPKPAALPADLAGWTASATDLAAMKAVTVATVDPATERLADVQLPKRPGRMAIATARVSAAGTYGVALGAKGWIDLYRVGDRTPLTAVAHRHGPDCSGIAKIVNFALAPGAYRIVVGGLDGATVRMMLVRG